MKALKFGFLFTAIVLTGAFTTGCEIVGGEGDEVRDISKAQRCLDDVPQNAASTAESCFEYVAKYDSQQANILKCSIILTSGGLNSSKLNAAYQAGKDSNLTNPSSVYISYLALDNPTTTGKTKADAAYPFCVKSEVSGLMFIAGLAKTGTLLASLNGGSFDINDPNSTSTNVGQILDDCANTGMHGGNSCDLAEVGNTLVDVSEAYCAGTSSDKKICDKVEAAIAAAGGNPEEAAKKFMCELKGGTYTGGVCS